MLLLHALRLIAPNVQPELCANAVEILRKQDAVLVDHEDYTAAMKSFRAYKASRNKVEYSQKVPELGVPAAWLC